MLAQLYRLLRRSAGAGWVFSGAMPRSRSAPSRPAAMISACMCVYTRPAAHGGLIRSMGCAAARSDIVMHVDVVVAAVHARASGGVHGCSQAGRQAMAVTLVAVGLLPRHSQERVGAAKAERACAQWRDVAQGHWVFPTQPQRRTLRETRYDGRPQVCLDPSVAGAVSAAMLAPQQVRLRMAFGTTMVPYTFPSPRQLPSGQRRPLHVYVFRGYLVECRACRTVAVFPHPKPPAAPISSRPTPPCA